jgi:hypothetical protein
MPMTARLRLTQGLSNMRGKLWVALAVVWMAIIYTCCSVFTAKKPVTLLSQQMQEDTKVAAEKAEVRLPVVSPAPGPRPVMVGAGKAMEERNLAVIPQKTFKMASPKIEYKDPIVNNPSTQVIKYTDIKEMYVGVPINFVVNIGTVDAVGRPVIGTTTMSIPDSKYYLIGLEAEFAGDFDIKPVPGQEQKQHKAQNATTASWRYEVTPLKRGAHKLLYTLRVYSEGDEAGTVIQIQPVAVQVGWKLASLWFMLSKLWIAIGGATIAAIIGLIKWWYDRKKAV